MTFKGVFKRIASHNKFMALYGTTVGLSTVVGTIYGITTVTHQNYNSSYDPQHTPIEHIFVYSDSIMKGLLFGGCIGSAYGFIFGVTSPISIPYFAYECYLKKQNE